MLQFLLQIYILNRFSRISIHGFFQFPIRTLAIRCTSPKHGGSLVPCTAGLIFSVGIKPFTKHKYFHLFISIIKVYIRESQRLTQTCSLFFTIIEIYVRLLLHNSAKGNFKRTGRFLHSLLFRRIEWKQVSIFLTNGKIFTSFSYEMDVSLQYASTWKYISICFIPNAAQ